VSHSIESTGGGATRRILLVDCDAFFVQVARLEDPEGAGREPLLLVGGSAASRGVITSASYEVREYGVRSGMPTARALRLCPRAVVVPVPRSACASRHREIRTVLEQWSPLVAAASIDEFYLDLSGTERLYRDASLAEVAQRVRQAVLEATRISVSIGGGTSRLVAKIAVRRAKPAGVHIVEPGNELAFMRQQPVRAIPGIGPKAEERLSRLALRSVADALDLGPDRLHSLLGRNFGHWLWQRAQGLDPTPVAEAERARSISRDETFARDVDDDQVLRRELTRLVIRAAADMRRESLQTRTITVRIRDADFRDRSSSRTLPEPVESDRALRDVALSLLASLRTKRRTPARLLSVSLSHFEDHAGQISLFHEPGEGVLESERDRSLARAVDQVRARHGTGAIQPGGLLDR
jgi:DNA polymerase-4